MAALQVDKGLFWIVITMLTFAVMIVMTRVLSRTMGAFTITLYSNITGLIFSLPFAFTLDQPIRMSTDGYDWLFFISTAIVVHGLANLIWNNQIRCVDASKASVLSNLEPFVAMVMGVLLLAKPITGAELLGSLLIVGGVVLSTYQRKAVQLL